MIAAAFFAIGIVLLVSAAVLLWLAFTAPDGFEDATGWHAGAPPIPDREGAGFLRRGEHGVFHRSGDTRGQQ